MCEQLQCKEEIMVIICQWHGIQNKVQKPVTFASVDFSYEATIQRSLYMLLVSQNGLELTNVQFYA